MKYRTSLFSGVFGVLILFVLTTLASPASAARVDYSCTTTSPGASNLELAFTGND